VFRLPNEAGDLIDDFIEVIAIGSDRFLPVFNTALASAAEGGLHEIPYIAYPSDVFFGTVMERRILPHLDPEVHFIPKVETALTLAAVEMAVAGVGVAWVPASLAQERISSGRLVDLSSALPACDLDISAMRLEASASQAAALFWAQLLDF
jgi:DNA-binding transcriptional LysR family regulator